MLKTRKKKSILKNELIFLEKNIINVLEKAKRNEENSFKTNDLTIYINTIYSIIYEFKDLSSIHPIKKCLLNKFKLSNNKVDVYINFNSNYNTVVYKLKDRDTFYNLKRYLESNPNIFIDEKNFLFKQKKA